MKSSLPSAGQRPVAGDVVIEREPVFAGTFRIRVVPDDTAPLAVCAHEVAVQLGRAVARTSGTNLWHCEGTQCRVLLRYRREAVTPSDEQASRRTETS